MGRQDRPSSPSHRRPGLDRLEPRVLFSAPGRVVALGTDPTYDSEPMTDVAVDAAGNVFTTFRGGNGNDTSQVVEVPAGSETPVVLASFEPLTVQASRQQPAGHVVLDPAGNLFGLSRDPLVVNASDSLLWELPAGADALTVVARFTAAQGVPTSLARDPSGNLYGTLDTVDSYYNRPFRNGSVFMLPAGSSTPTIVPLGDYYTYSFALAADAAGNLFGVKVDGPNPTEMHVYEVAAGTTTVTSPVATLSPTFTTNSGDLAVDPPTGFAVDPATDAVVVVTRSGLVLHVAPGAATGTTLATLPDSSYLTRLNPVFDGAGNVFVETGELNQEGADLHSVYRIPAGGETLELLADQVSAAPADAGLTIDAVGNVYGATYLHDQAAVFELTGSPAVPVDTTPTPTPTPTATGVTPAVVASRLPASALAGAKVKGTVTVTLTNATAAAVKGTVRLLVTAATDGGSPVPLAAVARRVNLTAGGHVTLTVPVRGTPAAAGTYAVLATATDPAGTALAAVGGPTFTVAPATVDLSVAVAATPTSVAAGRPVTLAVSVVNRGNVDAVGTLSVTAGLSTDGTTVAVPLVNVSRPARVKATRPTVLRFRPKVPAGTPAGAYTVVVTVAQPARLPASAGTTLTVS